MNLTNDKYFEIYICHMANKSASLTAQDGPGRRSAEHGAKTRERIEAAALAAFSEMGFEAASTRLIASRAGVNPQLITYHFETKLGLWKAVADRTFEQLAARLGERMRGLEGVADDERTRLMLREYIRYAAEHPEIARFMAHEGARTGPRLSWLVERHVRPIFESMQQGIREAQARGSMPAGESILISYVLIGATTMFSQAAEFELLTGRDPCTPEMIESHADLILGLLMPDREN